MEPRQVRGPAGLLQAYLHCTDVCPKGLNPALAIGKMRETMVRRAV